MKTRSSVGSCVTVLSENRYVCLITYNSDKGENSASVFRGSFLYKLPHIFGDEVNWMSLLSRLFLLLAIASKVS